MKTLDCRRFLLALGVPIFLIGILGTPLQAEDKPALALADLHGGLVVQLGGADTSKAAEISRTGRYVVNVLDTDPAVVAESRKSLNTNGVYGFASAETLTTPDHLPYSENVVNAVVLHALKETPLSEIHRILTPRGTFMVSPGVADLDAAKLEAAGFDTISKIDDGTLIAHKPWPAAMDTWSHPRHGSDGNAVSKDTAVGPPERVRWVAAAMSEVEGLVTEGGRNFYGGVLARDSFNGLRLWHQDLGKGDLNDPAFDLPRLTYDRARPVASGKYLFAIAKGKLVAFHAATGELAREYEGIDEPDEIINHRDVIIAADENQVRAFSTETAEELWHHDAGDARNLAANDETVTLIRGRPKRGEKSEAMAVDLYSGELKWKRSDYPWLDQVYRVVMHGEQMAYEVSSLSDHDDGNALHILSSKDGQLSWELNFAPGMNHNRQARAMFTEDDLWILHGGKINTADKENTSRDLIQVSALDPKTGETKKTHPAGLAHCFPPVATPNYVFAGVMDMTDMNTGDVVANRITKANCSRENGWVPANGLIYTTPKHCTCWPMLRGFVAMAPAAPEGAYSASRPIEEIVFPVKKGSASVDPKAANPGENDWPTYRGDRWRSGSAKSAGPDVIDTQWSVKLADPEALPKGPILFDWIENPYVKGPVTASTVANGHLYVAYSDAHEVIALNADTGAETWRFTARSRVDTPPTIHRGLALFGDHAGYVYALTADTGELVWEFQAAPIDERIVAYGQVESAFPVPGAVLVRGDTAYFVAGRQELADGGVLVFAVNSLTGEKEWVHRLSEIPQKADDTGKNAYQGFYENSGLEFDPIDILHEEGDGIAMSRWIFSSDGKTVDVDKWNAFAKLDNGGGDVWVPRGCWTYGARNQDRFRGEAPRRPLVAFHNGAVFGQIDAGTDIFRRDFDADAVEKFSGKWITGWEAAQKGGKGEKPYRSLRVAEDAKWMVDPFTPAEKKAEPIKPGTQLYNDIHALALAGNNRLYAVHKDGRLRVLNTADGSVVAERTVPEPMWDGLAIAGGKVYLSTQSGEVMCLGSE